MAEGTNEEAVTEAKKKKNGLEIAVRKLAKRLDRLAVFGVSLGPKHP